MISKWLHLLFFCCICFTENEQIYFEKTKLYPITEARFHVHPSAKSLEKYYIRETWQRQNSTIFRRIKTFNMCSFYVYQRDQTHTYLLICTQRKSPCFFLLHIGNKMFFFVVFFNLIPHDIITETDAIEYILAIIIHEATKTLVQPISYSYVEFIYFYFIFSK